MNSVMKRVFASLQIFFLVFTPNLVLPLSVYASGGAPVATDVSITTNEDIASGTITLTATDPETDPVTYVIVANPANGVLNSFDANAGTVVYTPNSNFNGSDTFTYKAVDNTPSDSNTATVTVTISSVNDNPDAVNDSATVTEDAAATTINVLSNDVITPDAGETLTISSVTQGTNGAVVITNSGADLTYDSNNNFNGSDSFTYTISDGNGGSDTATVNVTVSASDDVPAITSSSISPSNPTTNQTLTANATVTDVDGDTTTTYQWRKNGVDIGGATSSTLNLGSAGNGDKGDSIDVVITVADSVTTVASTPTAVVIQNSAPVASAGSTTTNEDTTSATITLGATDADAADTLSYSIVSGPSNGTLGTLSGNQLTYTPNANYNGSDSFTFKANDGTIDSNTATVSITVNAVNDAPVSSPVTDSTNEDIAKTITLSSSDVDGNSLTYIIVSGPTNGTLGAISGNQVLYTPNGNYNGVDSFTYKTNDGAVDSNIATVSLTVNAVNDAPTVTLNSPNGTEVWRGGGSQNITWTAADVEGSTVTINLDYTTDGTNYTNIAIGEANDGTYTWNPIASLNSGTVLIRATASDGTLSSVDSSNASFTIDSTSPTAPGNLAPDTGSPTNDATQTWSWSASTDGLSGVLKYIWSLVDNSSSSVVASGETNAATLTVDSAKLQGDWNFSVQSQDNAGNLSSLSTFQLIVDTTSPSVGANNSSSNWQTINPTITLSVLDLGGSGLDASKVRYRWDSAADATTGTIFTDGTTINIPSEGEHTLYLYAGDAAGNSSTSSGTYKLDLVNPTVSATGASSSWQASVPAITVSASDITSGVAVVKYAWDADASTGTVTTNGANLASTYPGDGNHTLNLYVQDNSGRSSTFSGTYKVDRAVPSSGSVVINSGAAYTNNVNVTLTIAGTDATSGVTEMAFSNGGAYSNWEAFSTTKAWTLASTDGTKTVRVKLKDAAGNETPTPFASDTIVLDTTNPVVSNVSVNNITTSNNNLVKNGDTVNVTATVTDTNQADITASMITANLSSLGGGASVNPTSYNTSTGVATWANITVSSTADASVSVAVNASDAATNAATPVSDSILADNTAPISAISAPANNAFSNINPSFTATASDTNGVASVKFQYKTGANSYADIGLPDTSSPYAADWGSTTLTTNTVYDLQTVTTDVAGNVTTTSGVSFTYDTTPPTITVTEPLASQTTDQNITVTGTTNEIATCTYSLDGGAATTMSTTGATSHTQALTLVSGSHSLVISCTDRASNVQTLTRSFSVANVSGNTMTSTTSDVSITSTTPGQADLPTSVTQITLGNTTSLDFSSNLTTTASAKTVKLESGTDGQPVLLINAGLVENSYVSIPDGTTISGPLTWDGKFQPTVATTNAGNTPHAWFSVNGSIVSLGSANVTLTLDKPLTIVLQQSRGEAAYKPAGSNDWIRISNICTGTYDNPGNPPAGSECYITNNVNTKILTYHLTSFATLEFKGTGHPAMSSGPHYGTGGSPSSTTSSTSSSNGGSSVSLAQGSGEGVLGETNENVVEVEEGRSGVEGDTDSREEQVVNVKGFDISKPLAPENRTRTLAAVAAALLVGGATYYYVRRRS